VLKSEKNCEKCIEKCEKSIETVEKFGKFCTPPAHLIEIFSTSHRVSFYQPKVTYFNRDFLMDGLGVPLRAIPKILRYSLFES
jgi:hypothetical protein